MKSGFESITHLQYINKVLERKVERFQSGREYVKMKEEHDAALREKDLLIARLRKELAALRRQIAINRNHWLEVLEDMETELENECKNHAREVDMLNEKLLRKDKQHKEALDKVKEQRKQIYALQEELEEEKGKNKKLTAQLNHDYENSSLPSSAQKTKKKKITNNRERSGKKPGAQHGHKHHPRKKQEPTEPPILLEPPREILEDPDFKKTKKQIVKQVIGIRVTLIVREYRADVYYNSRTGERVHAPFPKGVVNDVNYDGSIKAFLFLLNNDCYTSIDKSRKFLSDLTDGKLNISKGMINKLSREFAKKTEEDQKKLFQRILMSPVMHTDCTCARENGKNVSVFICAAPKGEAMYFARHKKGHEGVKGTPVEDYQGILIHDHELTFYNYGSGHQECLSHVLRYLKDSMQNEPDRTWNREMYTLVQEMIHYRNGIADDEKGDDLKGKEFEKRYDEILQKAKEEYEYIPASKYYRDGYNLYIRMREYKESHLLFLHDHRVPHNNNLSERMLRSYKRKQLQAMTFRSFETIDYLCQSMSMLILMREKGENIFARVSEIFG